MSAEIGITREAVLEHLAILIGSYPKLAHVSGHIASPHGRPTPIYLAGALPCVEYVSYRKPKLPEPVVVTQVARILAALEDGPKTTAQISQAISRSTSRVNKYLSELRATGARRVYIKRWQHPGKRGDLAPVYALGSLRDARKPVQTRADRYRKETGSPELRSAMNAKRRATDMAKATLAKPHGIFAALGL